MDTDASILDELEKGAGRSPDFRTDSVKVGAVYTMDYSRAIVAIYDFDRELAGGLPKGGLLIAAKQEGDLSFVLLRILKEARLPNTIANDQFRQQGVESTANERPWAEDLDIWVRNQVSLHGIDCRILGTFIADSDGKYRYAEDTDNYYAVNELLVWKPDGRTLEMIINYRHRRNAISVGGTRSKIGRTRFAAAEKVDATNADMLLDPTDLLQRRTVYLGMSRSGKSNAMKITAERIYRLRAKNPELRIGQLIFDPNGEYAQDNPQDGAGLHRIHESIKLQRCREVETYGLYAPPTDPMRTIMKINFFGDPFPRRWSNSEVEKSLDQLLAGREIVNEIMADEFARYTTSFRDVDLSVPANAEGNKGAQIRYRRAVLIYQTALAAAGLTPPQWRPTIRSHLGQSLFSQELIDAMKHDSNSGSSNQSDYYQAALILEESKKNNYAISWSSLETFFTALNKFIGDSHSYYNQFENEYISKPNSSGDKWADPPLQNLLKIFDFQNGPRSFQRAQDQHDPNASIDFAAKVVEDLQNGKLVIVDQSMGDPEQNRRAAERIMWRVFRTQQEAFRVAASSGALEANMGHILVYVEEAHNLLPRANAADNLRTVWARSAKEGSKMNIGMVLATQAPSSIMPEILSETDNWILAYLNSENERKVIAGYMDFEDFLEQIGQVSEPGFVRVRTLSLAYTVPVQFDRFNLDLPLK